MEFFPISVVQGRYLLELYLLSQPLCHVLDCPFGHDLGVNELSSCWLISETNEEYLKRVIQSAH